MSGTLNAERDPRLPKAGSSSDGVPDKNPAGIEIRLDAPHTIDAGRAVVPLSPDGLDDVYAHVGSSGLERNAAGEYGAVSDLEAPGGVASPPAAIGYDKLMVQAGQIADHLKLQCAELDRREFRLHEQLTMLDQERRTVRMWVANFDAEVQDREAGLTEREAACAERTAACLELEQELQELNQNLLRERHALTAEQHQLERAQESDRQVLEEARARQHRELEAQRTEQARELEEQRTQQARELAEQRDQQARELEEQRTQQVRDLDEQRAQQVRELAEQRQEIQAEAERLQAEFKQERILLENRLRFQQDHLHKSRQEFEAAQTEFRLEQQIAWTRLEETQAQIRLRDRQIGRLRDLWEERERSVERERLILFKSRRALEEQHRTDQENLRNEQSAWEHERETQRADLRRQQDMLALHAENLEARRARLDRLRAELEEINRNTLELRLAVEEAGAQLTQACGVELVKQRIDDARRILSEHYRYTRDSLTQQRHELDQLQTRVQQQREEFQAERQSLAKWVADREDQMRAREQKLADERAAGEAREQARNSAREQWTSQRLEAESIIRDLLQQLTDRETL